MAHIFQQQMRISRVAYAGSSCNSNFIKVKKTLEVHAKSKYEQILLGLVGTTKIFMEDTTGSVLSGKLKNLLLAAVGPFCLRQKYSSCGHSYCEYSKNVFTSREMVFFIQELNRLLANVFDIETRSGDGTVRCLRRRRNPVR
ncbi:hypothetical protein TcasGA2_TC003816 [Tribolium castaneum]|uniref:Uncharacterized protein n=1 Tax=Tribolium castaneum TaxID=7070 RepID=D6WF60_TRICA|nr:hypothetical protein TcasGA2_TC003816 [Tribolium castaneum]